MAGMLFLRHGLGAAAAVAAWATAVAADPGTCDDMHFAVLARRGRPAPRSVLGRLGGLGVQDEAPAAHPADARLVLGFGGETAVGVLPLAAFGNGHTFFVQRLQEARRPPCIQNYLGISWARPLYKITVAARSHVLAVHCWAGLSSRGPARTGRRCGWRHMQCTSAAVRAAAGRRGDTACARRDSGTRTRR